MIEELLNIGSKAIRHAEKLGADEAEAYLSAENVTSIKYVGGIVATRGPSKGVKAKIVRLLEPWLKKKGIIFMNRGVKAGVGVRAVIDKSSGFASVSSIEEKSVLKAVEEAINIAKIRPPDPNWKSLPDPKKPTGTGGIFDQKLVDMDPAQVLSLSAECCVAAADFDKRVTQAISGVWAMTSYVGVVNSRGVEVGNKGTLFVGFIEAKAREGDDEVSSSEQIFSRRFVDDIQELGVNASERAVACLSGKKLDGTVEYPVIFENRALSNLFAFMLAHNASAFNVQEERSKYKGKISELVADKKVSVVDDGTLRDGFNTTLIDDEGVPRQRTPIIERGVLKSFIYDNYSAKRESCESTGNASRRRAFGSAPFSTQPRVSPSNLMLEPRRGKIEDLICEVNDGILVKTSLMGVIHSNAVTGDFSVTATNTFRIKNGEVKHPLKPCTIGGNFHEALKIVEMIGNDPRTCGFFAGGVTCPSIVVERLTVSA